MSFIQNTNATYVKQPRRVKGTISAAGSVTPSTGALTGSVTLFSAGANGSKVNALNATSTDTASRQVVIAIFDGTNYFPIGSLSVPGNAGTTTGAVASVNLLDQTKVSGLPLDADGNPYILLESGDSLVASVLSLTASTVIAIAGTAGDF